MTQGAIMKKLCYWIAAAVAVVAVPWMSKAVHADSSDQPQIQTPEQQEEEAEQAQQQSLNNGGG
jgi:hypothetical protein